jgi:hypothetical protein
MPTAVVAGCIQEMMQKDVLYGASALLLPNGFFFQPFYCFLKSAVSCRILSQSAAEQAYRHLLYFFINYLSLCATVLEWYEGKVKFFDYKAFRSIQSLFTTIGLILFLKKSKGSGGC